MSAPVTTEDAQTESAVPPWDPSQPHHELAADVRWWVGSPLAFGLFGRLALDQVAYRKVAAAVDHSGRFAENFTNRGIRSYLWGPLMLFGDEADRRATAQRLRTMHGQVRGKGTGEFAGERFSALDPKLWKWVGTSSMLVFYRGYLATFGEHFDEEQREVVYRTLLHMTELYDVPSDASRIPDTVAEMESYYDDVAAHELADNDFLQWANRSFDALPVPTLLGPRWLHRLITPLWRLLTPALSRPARILSDGTHHPRMQELLGVEMTPWRRTEYRLHLRALAFFHRRFPKRLTLEPVAHNRYVYERLRAAYAGTQLEHFGTS